MNLSLFWYYWSRKPRIKNIPVCKSSKYYNTFLENGTGEKSSSSPRNAETRDVELLSYRRPGSRPGLSAGPDQGIIMRCQDLNRVSTWAEGAKVRSFVLLFIRLFVRFFVRSSSFSLLQQLPWLRLLLRLCPPHKLPIVSPHACASPLFGILFVAAAASLQALEPLCRWVLNKWSGVFGKSDLGTEGLRGRGEGESARSWACKKFVETKLCLSSRRGEFGGANGSEQRVVKWKKGE